MQLIRTSIMALCIVPSTLSFTPQSKYTYRRFLALSSDEILGDAPLDMKHAKYCADHVGECTLEDMEKICGGE